MKKLLLAAILCLCAGKAQAAMSVFDVGYSTFATAGVSVTSGTSVQINSSVPSSLRAANPVKYRITNAHPTWDIYIGDINVSTDTVSTSGAIGHVVKANGGTVDWPVAKDPYSDAGLVRIYARAADSATVDRLPRLSVTWFGQ